jgi:hypothetical protein
MTVSEIQGAAPHSGKLTEDTKVPASKNQSFFEDPAEKRAKEAVAAMITNVTVSRIDTTK